MKKLAKAAIAFVACYVVVVNMFSSVTHAQRIVENGGDLALALKAPLYVGAAVGLAADVGFNWSAGVIIYGDFHDFLFTSHSERHLHEPSGWRHDRAVYWCEQMDLFQENHCE